MKFDKLQKQVTELRSGVTTAIKSWVRSHGISRDNRVELVLRETKNPPLFGFVDSAEQIRGVSIRKLELTYPPPKDFSGAPSGPATLSFVVGLLDGTSMTATPEQFSIDVLFGVYQILVKHYARAVAG